MLSISFLRLRRYVYAPPTPLPRPTRAERKPPPLVTFFLFLSPSPPRRRKRPGGDPAPPVDDGPRPARERPPTPPPPPHRLFLLLHPSLPAAARPPLPLIWLVTPPTYVRDLGTLGGPPPPHRRGRNDRTPPPLPPQPKKTTTNVLLTFHVPAMKKMGEDGTGTGCMGDAPAGESMAREGKEKKSE